MPNGDDRNWVRVCAAIDGFRARYGRWPIRVRMSAGDLKDIRQHVLSRQGFALVTSVVELLADDGASFIAEGLESESYNYGQEGFPRPEPDETAAAWFGQAILRPDLQG